MERVREFVRDAVLSSFDQQQGIFDS
jgi:hypothetical protein